MVREGSEPETEDNEMTMDVASHTLYIADVDDDPDDDDGTNLFNQFRLHPEGTDFKFKLVP